MVTIQKGTQKMRVPLATFKKFPTLITDSGKVVKFNGWTIVDEAAEVSSETKEVVENVTKPKAAAKTATAKKATTKADPVKAALKK